MKPGKFLSKRYGINVRRAYSHDEGNCYWNLKEFPGAYFDAEGCVVFQTEGEYRRCINLSIGLRNTGVRNKSVGMSLFKHTRLQKAQRTAAHVVGGDSMNWHDFTRAWPQIERNWRWDS